MDRLYLLYDGPFHRSTLTEPADHPRYRDGLLFQTLQAYPLGNDLSLLYRLRYHRCRSEIRYTIYHQGRRCLRYLLREFNGHALLLRLCHLLYITDHRADLRDPLGDKESLVLSEDRSVVRGLYAAGLFHLFHHPDPQYRQPGRGHVQCRQPREPRRLS